MKTKEGLYIEMINQNKPLIYKIASLYTNNKEDRQDLIQEIAYQLWKSFDSFEHKSNISTWLYRIGMNTAIQFLKKESRKIKKQSLNNEQLFIKDDSDSETQAAIKEMLRCIEHLGTLEKGIILLYLEEKSHKAIAEIIGISVSNVGTRIQRIKKKLRNNTK